MSTTATTQRLTITDGPAAHVIWTAAQYAFDSNVAATVDFTLDQGLPQKDGVMWRHIKPSVQGACHEDGSGQSLMIQGYLDGYHFTGYYNARRRQGYLDVMR
jgi:hypothetical protein